MYKCNALHTMLCNAISKNRERGKTSSKKRDKYNKEEKSHVTPLVKNPAPPRDLANEDT